MDIIAGLERTISIIVNALEPLVSNDVLAGLLIVIVLLILLGRDTK